MNAAVHHPFPTQPRPDSWAGRHLYRFLDEEKYAGDLAQGRFRITTLRRVRAHEKLQGDIGEGSEWYFSDSPSSGDPRFEEVAARTGITIGPAAHGVTIRWNVTHRVVWDAYLLCLTKSFDPGRFAKDFGNFCCEITDARRFFDLVTDHLTGRPDWQCAEMGSVIYGKRTPQGLDFPSVPSMFVKPPIYEDQEEVRLTWFGAPPPIPLNPLDINIPALASLCCRIL